MVKRMINPQQIDFARGLRHQQTDAERMLWNKLRGIQMEGVKFRRQHPIGVYVVDFASLHKKLT